MLRGRLNADFLETLEGLARLSRRQVTLRAGFSNSFLYELAQNKRNPTFHTIDRLASVFFARYKELGYLGEDLTPGAPLQAMGILRVEDMWLKLLRVEVES